MKAAIDRHKSTLAQIPDAIKQKKQELLAKVREGRAICSSLEDIPRSAEEDKHQIAEVDNIQLEALKAIQDVLNLCGCYILTCILCGTNDNHIFCRSIVFLVSAKEPI